MPQNIDADIYGAQNADGTAVEYSGSGATKQALYLWMTSKKGEFVRNPGAGGMFDNILFKSMRTNNMQQLEFSIKNSFSNDFYPAVTLNAITVTPDYNNRIMSIDISYYDVDNQTADTVSIYTNIDYATKSYDYQIVDYEDENLRNFCLIKKSDIPNERLIFNSETNIWTWQKYQLTGLAITSVYFEDILQICNGS